MTSNRGAVVKSNVIHRAGRAGAAICLCMLGAAALHAQSSNFLDQFSSKVRQANDAVNAAKQAVQQNTPAGQGPAGKGGQPQPGAAVGPGSVISPIEVNGFVFGLERCENVPGSGVTCHFRATNTRADRALGVATGNSYIIDSNGNQFRMRGVQLGTGAAQTMTVANVPVEGEVLFPEVGANVSKLATVHMYVTGGQFDWRNVPLVAPQVDAVAAAPAAPAKALATATAQVDNGAAKPAAPAGASKTPRLTNDDVIKLTKAGLEEATVVQMVDASTPAFDTTANGLIALKSAGVSDKVIQHVLTRQSAN